MSTRDIIVEGLSEYDNQETLQNLVGNAVIIKSFEKSADGKTARVALVYGQMNEPLGSRARSKVVDVSEVVDIKNLKSLIGDS